MTFKRNIICRVLTLLAVLLVGLSPGYGYGEGSHRHFVIIGAGLSGLAAAQELTKSGFSNLTILEARHRIGGRAWTGRIGQKIPIDLGASWIHGIKDNPLADIARTHNIQMMETNYDNEVVYTGHGKVILWEKYAKLRQAFQDYAWDFPDENLQNIFKKFILKHSLKEDEKRYLRYFLAATIEYESGADIQDISMESFHHDNMLSGGDVFLPQGFSQIITALEQGKKIKMRHHVTEVNYQGERLVITTANEEQFKADYVIITVPLGVLKKGDMTFVPALPSWKQAAINALGMGLLNKVYLLFDRVFWDEEKEIIGHVGDKEGQWPEIINLYPYTKKPLILMFNAGEHARKIEQYSDQEIIVEALSTLENIYGDVPYPRDSLITRWGKDPWAGGSYSYLRAQASEKARKTLALPVANKLFFAGEATHSDFPSTAHGAYLSGIRAAREIMRMEQGSPP